MTFRVRVGGAAPDSVSVRYRQAGNPDWRRKRLVADQMALSSGKVGLKDNKSLEYTVSVGFSDGSKKTLGPYKVDVR